MRFSQRNLFLAYCMNCRFLCFFLLVLINYLYGDPHFIFITGGSASGKTTLAKTLTLQLGETRTYYLSLDNYLDKRLQPESDYIEGVPNFDHPSMINWSLLLQHIADLQKGQGIDTPVYDFFSWMPTGCKQISWKPIVIIEGIHAGQNQLDPIPGLRIFLHIPEDLQYKRRIHRDMAERGYSLEMSEKYFLTIALPHQKTFVDSSRHKAHIVIDQVDNQDYLEQAVSYITKTFEQNKTTGYDHLKIHLQYDQNKLLEEKIAISFENNIKAKPHELQ